ncbi:MAG: hypothetical protein QXG25_03850 [Nitrososphaerota archaeon]
MMFRLAGLPAWMMGLEENLRTIGNHYVVVLGDISRELSCVARIASMRIQSSIQMDVENIYFSLKPASR